MVSTRRETWWGGKKRVEGGGGGGGWAEKGAWGEGIKRRTR